VPAIDLGAMLQQATIVARQPFIVPLFGRFACCCCGFGCHSLSRTRSRGAPDGLHVWGCLRPLVRKYFANTITSLVLKASYGAFITNTDEFKAMSLQKNLRMIEMITARFWRSSQASNDPAIQSI
jgi:hypothetical protein